MTCYSKIVLQMNIALYLVLLLYILLTVYIFNGTFGQALFIYFIVSILIYMTINNDLNKI